MNGIRSFTYVGRDNQVYTEHGLVNPHAAAVEKRCFLQKRNRAVLWRALFK